MSAEFSSANVGTLKVNLNLDSDGTIAQSGATVAGTKAISINGFKAAGNLANANTVFDKILTGIGGGTYDSLSATKTISQGVTE